MKTKFKKDDIVNHVTNYGIRLLVTEVKQPNSETATYVCKWMNNVGIPQECEFKEFELILSEW